MTPVYNNSNDYYKKMLELQRRLRQSEEERIRLEERFSLLEHESRSRHETCINRLRMRYIEFLEEQQARDERNHKLLGALDRVDSSLALISAKTDRLGTMRRQYEAATLLKNCYVNRRGNGSVAGDSGVASQNNDGRVSSVQHVVSTFKHFAIVKNPPRNVLSVPTARTRNYSVSKNAAANSSYDSRRKRGDKHYENSQTLLHQTSPSSLSSNFHRVRSADTKETDSYVPRARRTNKPQLFPPSPRNIYPGFSSPNHSSSSLGYSRDPIEKLFDKSASAAYQNYSEYLDDNSPRSPPRFSRFADSWSEDLGEAEQFEENAVGGYHLGDSVENELERYMSRIPRLDRRVADCQLPSPLGELDQEQNTSGGLLNVTLSDDDGGGDDDDVEFSAAQEKLEAVEELEQVRETVRDGQRDRKEVEREKNKEYTSVNDAERRSVTDDNASTRATNGGRARSNIERAAEDDVVQRGTLASMNKTDRDPLESTDVENKLPIVCSAGEERDAGNHFREYADTLEPWNISDLERKLVQGSMITQDEPAGHQRQPYQNPSTSETAEQKNAVRQGSALRARGDEETGPALKLIPEVKAEHSVIAQHELINRRTEDSYEGRAPDTTPELATDNRVDPSTLEYGAIEETHGNRENTGLLYSRDNYEENPGVNGEYEGTAVAIIEQYHQAQNDSSRNSAQYHDEDPGGSQRYSSYEVNADQQYHHGYNVGADDQDPRYSTEPSEDYAIDTNGAYVTDDTINQQYVSDNNAPYITDTKEQYVSHSNEHYVTEPSDDIIGNANVKYVADNSEQYISNIKDQYVADANQQYVNTGVSDQYVSDTNQHYGTDTNEAYLAGANEQYVRDVNQEYPTDPNQEYPQDQEARQYEKGGLYSQVVNEDYPAISDPNNAYPEAQEYPAAVVATADDQIALVENEDFVADDRGYVQDHDKTVQETETQNELLSRTELDQSAGQTSVLEKEELPAKKRKDVIKSLLDSDTESTIERNVSINAESDFDFN